MKPIRLLRAATVGLAIMVGLSTASAQQTQTITMGTAGPGSVVYVWTSSLANALDSVGAPTRVQVNAGVFDTEAMRILNAGGGGLSSSFVSGSALVAGSLGRPPFEGAPLTELRGAFPLGQAPVAIVVRADSGIKSLHDLEGKRVTAGPAGGNDVFMREFLRTVAPDMRVEPMQLSFGAFASSMQDRRVDAIFVLGWPPYPTAVEAAALMDIDYIQIDAEAMDKWLPDNPQHHRMTVPAGLSPQQDEELETFGHVSHLIVSSRVDETAIYELTRAWMREDVRAMLIAATPTWEAAFDAFSTGLYFQDLEALNVKLHPGAVRAYDEAGIPFPDAIRP